MDSRLPPGTSPTLDPRAVEVAVVIPTYKRPDQLAATLRSVAGQRARWRFAAVVVENDALGGEGFAAASALFESGDAEGFALVEPRQGNCNAYNAGFAAALARFPNLTHVAIIDDDEIAGEGWLDRLLEGAEAGVDIVGGPQIPVFEDECGRRRFAAHPVFRSAHEATGSAGLITSTGNCLIAAQVLRRMGPPWLDESFNFLGGGDTDFFTRCRAAGCRFGWVAEAQVRETVPKRRTSLRWITARSIRNGLISALIQRRQSPGFAGRLKVVAKSLALLAASPFRSALLWARTGSAFAGSYHMMVAAGRLLAEFGWRIEQYRAPEKN